MTLASVFLVSRRPGRPRALAMLAVSLSWRLALTKVLWGASYGPTRRSLMPALMVRTCTSGCLILLPSLLTRGSS